MKRLLLALVGLCWLGLTIPGPALGAAAVAQSDVTTSSAAGNNLGSTALTTSAGNTLLAFLADYTGLGGAASAVADTPNGAYTATIAPTTDAGTSSSSGLWYVPNSVALSSQSVTGQATGGAPNVYQTLITLEISGVTSASKDNVNSATTASTTTPSISVTTTQASDLLCGYFASGAATGTFTEASGWTPIKSKWTVASTMSLNVACKTAGGAGSYAYNPVLGTAQVVEIGVIALKATGGVAAVRRGTLMGVGP